MDVYVIANWDQNFENNRTRELKRLDWVPVPNKQDGEGYTTLMHRKDGLELMGTWIILLELASKCEPRGTLIRANGEPHTAETIARMTQAPQKKVAHALGVLSGSDIGWIQKLDSEGSALEAAFDVTAAEKKRAHGRVNRELSRADGEVWTPVGKISERPKQCQWCKCEEKTGARGFPGIVAHHPLGYGSKQHDLTVMFVCRSCHGLFESGKLTTAGILDRFGYQWFCNIGSESHPPAKQCDTSAIPSIERNGKERKLEKGIEETPLPPVDDFEVQRERFCELWNNAPGVRTISSLSAGRESQLRRRLSESVRIDAVSWSWLDALEEMVRKKFPLKLTRGDPSGWKPDVDWILKPDSLPAIIEGKYDWEKIRGSNRPAVKLGASHLFDPNSETRDEI